MPIFEKYMPAGLMVKGFKAEYFDKELNPYILNIYATDVGIIDNFILTSNEHILSLLESLGTCKSNRDFTTYLSGLSDKDKFFVYFSFLCLLYLKDFDDVPIPVIHTADLFSELFKNVQLAYSSYIEKCLAEHTDIWYEIMGMDDDVYFAQYG